ncbi:hypothetical protein MTY_2339 [Moorella thermoacetica Y72]|uniref:Uncharacterized protein n=1 Tax=Moorella thermoacetica Y72 TaxID=1325331 RepID=A0A0S6UHK4_NEOTH|nr:hypothetical protein MTY_2339 [Moorella thermoacetica Y72]
MKPILNILPLSSDSCLELKKNVLAEFHFVPY